MQGTVEAVHVKNKSLQDVDGPTFHDHFSNGPSLNRIVVFQDHVGSGRGSYVFNLLISFIWIESKFEYFQKQVDI